MAVQRQVAELGDAIASERAGRREELHSAVSQLNSHIRDVKDAVCAGWMCCSVNDGQIMVLLFAAVSPAMLCRGFC